MFYRVEDRCKIIVQNPLRLHERSEPEPDLVVLPDAPDLVAQPELWWMTLCCPWGSCHTRLFGDTAPDPPWQQGNKWSQPVEWIRSLDEEK